MAEDEDHFPIGSSVCKRFFVYGQKYCDWFKGKVTSYNNRTGLYKVVYDDGDSEDCSIGELKTILVVSSSTRSNRTTITTSTDSGAVDEHRTTINEEIEEERIPIGSKVRAQWKVGSKLKWFQGKVTSYTENSRRYNVVYEDGDEEQCTFEELKPYLVPSRRSKPKGNKKYAAAATMPFPSKTSSAKKKNQSDAAADDDDDDDEIIIPIGSKVRRRFMVGRKAKWFVGEVVSYDIDSGRYKIVYEDGDSEDCSLDDFKTLVVTTNPSLLSTSVSTNKKPPPTASTRKKPVPKARSQKKANRKRTWDESFHCLKNYKEVNGNCNIPKDYPSDQALVSWVSYQREVQNTLPTKQRFKLEQLGFFDEPKRKIDDTEWIDK